MRSGCALSEKHVAVEGPRLEAGGSSKGQGEGKEATLGLRRGRERRCGRTRRKSCPVLKAQGRPPHEQSVLTVAGATKKSAGGAGKRRVGP